MSVKRPTLHDHDLSRVSGNNRALARPPVIEAVAIHEPPAFLLFSEVFLCYATLPCLPYGSDMPSGFIQSTSRRAIWLFFNLLHVSKMQLHVVISIYTWCFTNVTLDLLHAISIFPLNQNQMY
jgi:hypothetical protein